MNNNNKLLINGGKLVGQGVDGCVHNPPIYSCNIKKYMNNKYVSKLQFYNKFYKNEVTASQLIKDKYTNSHKHYFSIILHKCQLTFEQINTMYLFDNQICSFFSEFKINPYNNDQTLFAFTIYRYVNGFSIRQLFDFDKSIILFQNDSLLYLKQIITNFFYLQKSIFMLHKIQIIHNDLHYYNIMIDTHNNNLPIIIDFGRSFVANLDNYDYFVSYVNKWSFKPERTLDSFDVRFISYILKYKPFYKLHQEQKYYELYNFLTTELIDEFIDIIIKYDFEHYQQISNYKFNFDKIVIMYKKFLQNYLYKFADKKTFPFIHDVVFYIYSNSIIYNIDSHYIIFIFLDFSLSNYYKLSKINNINIFIDFFINYLFVNINPDINYKFLYNKHLYFFKYIYKLFKSYQFSQNPTYINFYNTIILYFKNNNINIYYFLANDIFKYIYNSRTYFIDFFGSSSFYY
tara:strand:+ start:316 stop:1689 length:1374 start_codon:yes stop_codon:yes gene_type:complete